MIIDDQLILNLENLAKLKLSSDERERIKTDLNAMLELVSKMNEVDTEGVQPLLHLSDHVNGFREDSVGEHQPVSISAKNAPAFEDNFFVVPKFIKANSKKSDEKVNNKDGES